MKILLTPLGLSPGSLFSAILLTRPDHVIVLTSQKGVTRLEEIIAEVKKQYNHFELESHIIQDPFIGFQEGRALAKKIAERFTKEGSGSHTFVANLAGGTTALQDAVKCLADLLGAQEVAVIDRRPVQMQQAKPFVIGELVEVPPIKLMPKRGIEDET